MKPALRDEALDHALSVFAAKTGLVFPGNRRGDFVAGVERAMARRGVAKGRGLAEDLRLDRGLLDEIVAEVTVHESYFFREPAQFDAIRTLVLPQLRRDRPADAPLHVWSAGCARGEEAYSLAILLEQEGLLGRSRICGTDISRAALADAVRARYTHWSFRGTEAAQDPRYFQRRGTRFQPHARIRDSVAFQPLNLAAGPYPPPASGAEGFDLILCRNVLIYFETPTVKAVAEWLHEALAVGGWLITAPADPPLWDHAPFEVLTTPAGILHRKPPPGTAALRPAAKINRAVPKPVPAARPSTEPVVAAARPSPARPPPPLRRPAPPNDAAAWLARVKKVANGAGATAAEPVAAQAAGLHPTSAELQYIRAILLVDLRRWDDAIAAIRRLLYLDRTLIAGHALLASVLRRRGDLGGARRAYQTVLRLCAQRPPDELAPLADGERVHDLAALAAAELEALRGPEAST